MTPFGLKLRQLRKKKKMTQVQLAKRLNVSAAYLSALENGRRGLPSWAMVQDVIEIFELIWDEAEKVQEAARLSQPKVKIDTSDLGPKATELANRLAREIARMNEKQLENGIQFLKRIDTIHR